MLHAPWLDEARSYVGVKEIRGKKHNPIIVEFFREVGHEEVTDDETAWCAAFNGACLKRTGYPTTPENVNLLARSYLSYGTATTPQVGAIAVWPRGKSTWQGHVNIVDDVRETNGKIQVRCIGGNQSNAVTKTGWLDADKALGFRWPIAPTVKDLRQAGSSEIGSADTLETGAVVSVGAGVAGAIAEQAVKVPDVTAATDAVVQHVSLGQKVMGAVNGLAKLVIASPWLAVVAVVAVAGLMVARWWKRNRVKRHQLGLPISREIPRPSGGAVDAIS